MKRTPTNQLVQIVTVKSYKRTGFNNTKTDSCINILDSVDFENTHEIFGLSKNFDIQVSADSENVLRRGGPDYSAPLVIIATPS